MKNDFKVTNSIPLRCRAWRQEALLRLLENVLAVGNELGMMAYAPLGRATRDHSSPVAIVHTLQIMTEDYTLIIQSGKPVFTEAFLRPLFCRAIGPFRWIALSNEPDDIHHIDEYMLQRFADNHIVTNWIGLAQQYVPFEGLPARIAWLGHGARTELALAVNQMVADGRLKAPIAFTRGHLDAGAMAHPYIMTENLRDGSDVIADWPLINAMLNCASGADLVAIHSNADGDSSYMTSASVTIIADGTPAAAQRLQLSLTNDTSLGIIRYADAGYPEAIEEAIYKGVGYIALS